MSLDADKRDPSDVVFSWPTPSLTGAVQDRGGGLHAGLLGASRHIGFTSFVTLMTDRAEGM